MVAVEYLHAGGAFLLAALWSAVLMPSAINLGERFGMTSRPRLFGSRRRRTISYLGGMALAGTVMAGFFFAGGWSKEAGVILTGGLFLLFLGLVDDRSAPTGISLRARLAAATLVATAAWAAGLRIHAFELEWVDAILTIFSLVALAYGFNLLDNMDGVAGSTAATVAVALFSLAALRGQPLVAILAAALLGGSVGFLRHNFARARVYLGNGGALFLGFLLAATAIKLKMPLDPPWGLAALIALFAVPATDTSMVMISRALAARPLFRGGTDHISHRLVQLGLRPGGAALVHALAAAAGGGATFVAIKTGQPGILLAVISLFALVGLAQLTVRVYEPEPRLRRPVAVGIVAGLFVALIPSLVAGVLARADLEKAREGMLAAREQLLGLQPEAASQALDTADAALIRAEGRLEYWATFPGRLMPGVRGNLRVATALAKSGRELVAAGREALDVMESLPLENGQLVPLLGEGAVDLAPFRRALGPASRLKARVARAESLINSTDGLLLLPQVRAAKEEAARLVSEARHQAEVVEGAAFLIPRAFGTDGKRTWLVGAENTAELRGRGGYVGALGVVEAEYGHFTLGGFIPTSALPLLQIDAATEIPLEYENHYKDLAGLAAWPNLLMSPHFPSGARLLLTALEPAGLKASGLISMDPVGLSYLLDATGPIRVEGLPNPVTSGNVVEWSLNQAYFQFQGSARERKEVIGEIAQAVWRRVIAGQGIDAGRLARAVGRALSERRLVIYSTDAKEQALIESLEIAGAVEEVSGDYLLVLGQNFGENKMDYYLERHIDYRGEVQSDGSIESVVEVTIRNLAPSADSLPQDVGGSRPHLGLGPGTARSYLNVLVPPAANLVRVLVDGEPTDNFWSLPELGKRLFSVYLDVGPGESKKVVFGYRVPKVLQGNRYRLTVQNQATVRPDTMSVSVKIPARSVIRLSEGFIGGKELSWEGTIDSDKSLAAEVNVPLYARIIAQISSILRRPLA
jgi:UDP-N-acetylmuramyl pentapeptide phosphotransferase/UDP-N-acetylglucosamine-1-phosphate transferase